MRIILASASERRKELLEQIGYEPVVVVADIDEQSIRHRDPVTLVQLIAHAKLDTVCRRLAEDSARARVPVLAADTVVLCRGEVLEKPATEAEARSMLESLAGRTHQVLTGVAVQFPDTTGQIVRYAETHVTFSQLSHDEISWYLQTDEWKGVAGAYRIQDSAARFITAISGSYSNVVGLPLHLVYSILTS